MTSDPTPPEPAPPEPASPTPPGASPRDFVLVALVFEGGLGVLAFLVGYLAGHDPLVGFGEKSSAVSHLAAIGWGLAATFPLAVGLLAMDWIPSTSLRRLKRLVQHMVERMFPDATMLQMALVSLAAGVGEELLFRGLLQQGLAEWIGGPSGAWAALLIASVIFGACHCLSVVYFITASLMGVYLGLLLWATGDVLAPIVTHAAYDFVALVYLTRRK